MNTNVDPRSAQPSPTRRSRTCAPGSRMMEAAGEVTHISGAEREREIGGIVDIYQRKIGNPLVLFDDIPGYPKGHRILANLLTSIRRINMTMGNPADGTEIELVRHWRKYMKEAKTIPPVEVASGALLENVKTGDDIDLFKIPVPRWHEHDGGYYIGTGDMVIMRDPDTGWINYGAYRVQAHDKKLATVMCSKGKHGDMIQKKYHERGQPCPVAVVCGMHPALFMIAGLEIPHGKNEYDAAGGLLGEPVQVIIGPKTGLPIPAHAEIAFEGFIHPNDKIDEGPLGEWTGYYAGGLKKEPAIRIETMMYRDDPILLGRDPRHSAGRRLVLSRLVSLRRGVEPARSGGRARGEGRVVARRRRLAAVAHRRDQADVRRPRQAGRADRLAVPRRRLRQPLRRGGRRRHRSRRHGQGDLGDVHALRSARGHGDPARLLVVGARSDGLLGEATRATPASSSTPASRSAAATRSRSWCGPARRSRIWCAASSATSCRSDDGALRYRRVGRAQVVGSSDPRSKRGGFAAHAGQIEA